MGLWTGLSFFLHTSKKMSLRIAVLLSVSALLVLPHQAVDAALVTISTSTPTGTANRNNNTDFIGLLSNNSPNQVLGQNVTFNNVPAGETFQVGDLVGRDIDGSGGGRVWTYRLDLPIDAFIGTGFENIQFRAHTFERDLNNLEGIDEITWELFLNGSATAVDSATTGQGQDFTSIDIGLSDPGGATVSTVEVVFTVIGFDAGSEWFVSQGVLQASYDSVTSVPEPSSACLMLAMAIPMLLNRRRRKATGTLV